MKTLKNTIVMLLFTSFLFWLQNGFCVQAAEESIITQNVNASFPTEEELSAWEADGTLQQRIDFMKSIEANQTAEGLIAKWNQTSLFSLNVPEYWQGGMPSEGDVKALVFLVEFADMKNTNASVTPDYVQKLLFGPENKEAELYPYESLTAYYQRSSYNKLQISGDVYGWYTLSENRSAYENDWEGREKLIKELLDAYDEQIDLSDYDADGDGNVDAIYIHYAGGDTGWGSQWWSYMGETISEIKYDETSVNKYLFLSDMYNSVTAIHETGHLLGLPDYYSYEGIYSKNEKGGVGRIDMMDHNVGDHNIFSKMLLGWVEPYIVTETEEVTLELLSSSEAQAVLVAKENISSIFDEYYVLELYNNSGNNVYRERSVPKADAPLVKIYHVDARLNEFGTDFAYDNTATEHKLIKLLESDGLELNGLSEYDVLGSKYYDTGMSLGPNTLPSSEWYGGIYSGIEIKVISILEDEAKVQISFDVEDTVAPEAQDEPLQMSTDVFGMMPVGANTIRILFDCYIYQGNNFDGMSLSNKSTGANITINYDILNPRGDYPESVNRYHIIEMMIEDDLSFGTEYIISIPADCVKDAAGNGNNAIELKFQTLPQHKEYVITHDLSFDILPDNLPAGVEIVPGYEKEVFYMENGNTVVTYVLSGDHGGVLVYSPNKEVISNTYSDANITCGELYALGSEHYLLVGNCGYAILHENGTVVKTGSYSESNYCGIYYNITVVREDCVDILLWNTNYSTNSGFYVCRVSEGLEISYIYPDNVGSEIAYFDKEYLYRNTQIPDQYNNFAEMNYQYDTLSYHRSYRVEGTLSDKKVFENAYHFSSFLDWTSCWDSNGSIEINDSMNRKYAELFIGYGFNYAGLVNIKSVGDGYVIFSDACSVSSSPTLTGSEGYMYHTKGIQIIRMDENLNVMWTTYIPENEEYNLACSPMKIGDTIYLYRGSEMLAIDDSTGAEWISSDKGFFIQDTVGDLNEEKQMIAVSSATTPQNIADNVKGSYESITFYNAGYEEITDWSKAIHNGIMCITSTDGFYKYYYQITDIDEISLSSDYVELLQDWGGVNLTIEYTNSDLFALSEDAKLLYVVSDNGAIASGYISSYFERSMSIIAGKDGETTLTVKNLFGDAEAKCEVLVYPTGTVLTTGVMLDKENISLGVGNSETLTATVLPEDATNQGVKWSSLDETVATVDNDGTVTAVSPGTTTIMVATEGRNAFTASCEVNVTNPVVEEPVESFVTRMYEQCLSREPDQSGLEGWVGQLENGNMNGAQIAEQFVFSAEMLKKNLSNEEFVNVLYRAMMGREADAAGRTGWVNELNNGYLTRSEVTKCFVESTEFTNICAEYGITRGDYDASMAPIEHFVTRFYTLCLERYPDQEGMYGWVNNLKHQYMNGAQIAEAFIFSDEFLNKNVSDEKYVELLYNTLLGRPSDANGKAGWVGELQGGHMTRKGMMKAFIESIEFGGICEEYGITRGTVE